MSSERPNVWPQPTDLFTGEVSTRLAAAVVYRYVRIGSALQRFALHPARDTDVVRRRWRIGLHLEFVNFKRAIGDLLISGCTGGVFFSWCTFPWIDHRTPDQFIIDWSKVVPLRQFDLQLWMHSSLPIQGAPTHEWWNFDTPFALQDAVRPVWWDVSEMQIADFIPVHTVPAAQLTIALRILQASRSVLTQVEQMIYAQFGQPPST
ncbi:hypothetical protein QCA50_003923 [Cerrena zonata]|uniref:Uncharacterized protein n=1 Tax=Cerrena zonata TaxID=2478898 RepID=A0AAW0GPZ6_9APHY